ncbi:MAG: hypothetical protein ACYS8W_21170, partial [Planctomycetota bacterium]
LYYEYGRFLAEASEKGTAVGDREEKEIKGEAGKYLEKAKELYEYRAAHGGGRKELNDINGLLDKLPD